MGYSIWFGAIICDGTLYILSGHSLEFIFLLDFTTAYIIY